MSSDFEYQSKSISEGRRGSVNRRISRDRRKASLLSKRRDKLADELRMQARVSANVNVRMKVEPRDLENTLEFKVAKFLESLEL